MVAGEGGAEAKKAELKMPKKKRVCFKTQITVETEFEVFQAQRLTLTPHRDSTRLSGEMERK